MSKKIEPRGTAGEIPVFCRYDEIVPIEKAVENPKNPNTHGEKQLQLLSQIIKSQGWRAPITISTRSGFIVKGHGRLQAARLLNAEFVPVEYQDYQSEAEEYADLIADNRLAELGQIDDEMLKDLLTEMDLETINLTGYTSDEIDALLEGAQPIDEIERINDENLEGTTQFEHKLKCGQIETILTDDEYESFLEVYKKYVEENGVSFGFIRSVLNG